MNTINKTIFKKINSKIYLLTKTLHKKDPIMKKYRHQYKVNF
jgi:hypothetical protein